MVHVTTPSVFTMRNFNQTVSGPQFTTTAASGLPVINNASMYDSDRLVLNQMACRTDHRSQVRCCHFEHIFFDCTIPVFRC